MLKCIQLKYPSFNKSDLQMPVSLYCTFYSSVMYQMDSRQGTQDIGCAHRSVTVLRATWQLNQLTEWCSSV